MEGGRRRGLELFKWFLKVSFVFFFYRKDAHKSDPGQIDKVNDTSSAELDSYII